MLIVGLVAGVASNFSTRMYKSTARVLLTPNDPTQALNPASGTGLVGNDPDRYVVGQINIVESEAVAAEAAKRLTGVNAVEVENKLSVAQHGRSNVLRISAIDPRPATARDIAQAVAEGYIENRRQAAVSGLQAAADDIQARLAPLQAQIAQLDEQIGERTTPGATSVLVSPAGSGPAGALSQPAAQVPAGTGNLGGAPTTQESLKAARYAAAVQYENLYSRQQELLVDISLKRGDAELIANAKIATEPLSPQPRRDAVLGACIGLLLGFAMSFLREQLNDRVRTGEEVERLVASPLLAQLPYDDAVAKGRSAGLATVQHSTGALSEGLRSLRTSIQYIGVDTPIKVILITSAAPGEGKSLVASNLAAAFAQADYKTLLISADLRRPSIERMFGDLAPSPGVTGVLAPSTVPGAANGSWRGNGHRNEVTTHSLGTALVRTELPSLMMLPAGQTPPNPSELLGSQRMAVTLDQYRTQFDIIVIDSPPLLPVTDAAVLSAKVDGVVLVAALNESRRDGLTRAAAILQGSGARLLGVAVNKSPTTGGRDYYYSKYYGPNTDLGKRRGSRRRTANSDRANARSSLGAQ